MNNAVSINELSKRFDDNDVLKSVSLDFVARKIYGLVGRNGSGKSVLMKCIAGLLIPTSGSVVVFGKKIGKDSDFAPNTGIAIEQPGILLRKTARENMRILASLTVKPSMNEIDELIKLVGLNPNDKKPAGKYSMGMKQRLSIAMALLGNPDLLLLDEPMSNLDSAGCSEMRSLFRKLSSKGKTLLIATHVQKDVDELCDGIVHMSGGRATYEEKVIE
jgi:ABC-2 type transport system ATP-binding protein